VVLTSFEIFRGTLLLWRAPAFWVYGAGPTLWALRDRIRHRTVGTIGPVFFLVQAFKGGRGCRGGGAVRIYGGLAFAVFVGLGLILGAGGMPGSGT